MLSEEILEFWKGYKDKISKSASNLVYRAYLAQRDLEHDLVKVRESESLKIKLS